MSKVVYLIQCPEHADTNIYKIGRSDKGPQRIRSYGKDIRIVCVLNHDDPVECEKNLIAHYFNTYYLFKGNEYFKINISETALKLEFIDIVTNDRKFIKNKSRVNDHVLEDFINNEDNSHNKNDNDNSMIVNDNKQLNLSTATNRTERYYCNCCKYLAKEKHHMTKHTNTQKHKQMSQIYEESGKNIIVKKVKLIYCKYCKKEFIDNSTKWRHEKNCGECIVENISTTNVSNNSNKNNQQNIEINCYKNMIDKYELLIDKLIDSNNK